MSRQASSSKMGFWAVFAFVVGSQIGSGVFMLPANLAPFGFYSLLGWIISGMGAIALARVFAQLCAWIPKTGGPHAYVQQAFGNTLAFFTGWTYWVISWVSTTVVIVASVGYLTPLLGSISATTGLVLSIVILLSIATINLFGVHVAGRAEFFLTLLKIIPLGIIPLLALFFFDSAHFMIDQNLIHTDVWQMISRVTLLTLWGFIGIESATTAAESVENPAKTIPRAVIAGTATVALLYIINSIGIMGAISGSELALSNAPYVDATRIIFGSNWYILISLIASIICLGTLNAWTLVASHIALGLSQDGFMPGLFAQHNRYGAPYWSIIISSGLIIPLLIVTVSDSLAHQVFTVIDFSVTAFLFVYVICCLAFFKLLWQKKSWTHNFIELLLTGIFAICFCGWILYQTPAATISIAGLFALSGIPVYLWYLKKK